MKNSKCHHFLFLKKQPQKWTKFSTFYLIFKGPPFQYYKVRHHSLNLEEDLWRRPIELRAETNTQEEILTVRSRNCRSSCSQVFTKISVLKHFAIFTEKHLCWGRFLRKLLVLKPANLLKGDSNTGVFL